MYGKKQKEKKKMSSAAASSGAPSGLAPLRDFINRNPGGGLRSGPGSGSGSAAGGGGERRAETFRQAMSAQASKERIEKQSPAQRTMQVASNPALMAVIAGSVVLIVLLLIKPPFVMNKSKNRLEEPKFSPLKAVAWALVTSGVVFAGPFILARVSASARSG
jgi:hypothetical protein